MKRVFGKTMIFLALFGAGTARGQFPLGTPFPNLQQEQNLFLLNRYLEQPGKAIDLESIGGLMKLPELGNVISNPGSLPGRVGLGVSKSFYDPAIGRINYSLIPVFPKEQAPSSNPVLPESAKLLAPLAAMSGGPVQEALLVSELADPGKTCPVVDEQNPEGLPLPQLLALDPGGTELAVVELKPDPNQPNLWVPQTHWTAVSLSGLNSPGGGTLSAVKIPKSKPKITPQNYKLGPISAPVGINLNQNWKDFSDKTGRFNDHQLQLSVNATRIDQTLVTFRSSIPGVGKTGNQSLQYILISQPVRQQALTGVALQNEKGNTNTFLGYETHKGDRTGSLIVQMTHTEQVKGTTTNHTTGFIARLGKSPEATGLYQLRQGSLIASATLTPVRFQNLQTPEKVSSGASFGVSYQSPNAMHPVNTFVNVSLLKDWSQSQGIAGEVSGGVMMPRSGVSMFIVLPMDYFFDQNRLGPRVQAVVPLNRKPAQIPGKGR
jgi:hypothetical protein